jgi:AAA domain
MKIITADERLREKSGVKMLIVGPAKIGKTSQLRTLDPQRTLFIDLEAGDLAVRDWPVATLRPQTWQQCRDLAAFSPVQTRRCRQLPATARRTTTRSAPNSKACSLIASIPILSTRSPSSAGCAFATANSSPKPFRTAPAGKMCALPTACTHAK